MWNSTLKNMDATFENIIKNRRSIRAYKKEVPTDDLIQKLIASALCAPSPSNRQPVRFVMIKSNEKREAIRDAMYKGKTILINRVEEMPASKKLKNWINFYYRHSEFMFDAPCLFGVGIVVEKENLMHRLITGGVLEKGKETQDDNLIALGISVDHFLLQAVALGLGTCILTAPILFIKESGEFPLIVDGINLSCFVTAGFPQNIPSPSSRKNISEIFVEV
ncbi:MAG: nitroreductase family protein [Deltaproteobacteria bacterium]